MSISIKTARAIVTVLRRHVTRRQLRAILEELADTPGNASFRESIQMLLDQAATMRGDYAELSRMIGGGKR